MRRRPPTANRRLGWALGFAAALAAWPAPAQLVGGGLPGLPGGGLPGNLPDIPRVTRDLPNLGDRALQPTLQAATSTLTADLGLEAVVLGVPAGKSAVAAVRELRTLDPAGQFDFNHLYVESGALGRAAVSAAVAIEASSLRVGLVDGSVAASRPALANARLVQQAFAPGGARATPHATAVASLIVGSRGAAPGATLEVADVYGPTPTGGSADAIARGLAWLAREKVPVISISLVGPPNLLLGAAVQALIARGHLVVAAVGNDGPAAAPLYPAAYPGVVAVTGVDARRRVLPEAGRGTHVDFAAPGADVTAAGPAGGFVTVRGTSFAAPVVAARLAALLRTPNPAGAKAAIEALGRQAVDLGAPGPDPIYGRGFVDAGRR